MQANRTELESSAREAAPAAIPVLLVTAGGRTCALQLGQVLEVMRPQPAQPFASQLECLDGVAIIRGDPTPVVNLARLLGAAQAAEPTRLVTLRLGTRVVALAVDSVLGFRVLAAELMVDLPPLLKERGSEHVERLARLDGELVILLRAARCVPDELWQELEAPA